MQKIWTFLLMSFVATQLWAQGNNISVGGTVHNADTKSPLANAIITLNIMGGYNQFSTTTDSNGEFTFIISGTIIPGEYPISIEKEGFYTRTGFLLIQEGIRLPYYLKPKPDSVAAIPKIAVNITDTVLNESADNNLVFLLDASGSMNEENKINILKTAMKYLLTLYRPQDRVAIVTYSDEAQIYMASSNISSLLVIQNTIDSLKCVGKTEGGKGLDLAYKVLLKNYIPDGNNKVILVTDGLFSSTSSKSGKTMEKLILNSIEKKMKLSVFSVGRVSQKVKDHLGRMATMGGGNYAHLTNEEEAIIQMLKEAGFDVVHSNTE